MQATIVTQKFIKNQPTNQSSHPPQATQIFNLQASGGNVAGKSVANAKAESYIEALLS